ncbi:putative glycogen synthase kinase 3 (Gsk3) [Fasciola gigantica]|uniref:Putative glycogen synthase kinase 3 (Gsk3) n=1 Tax=Fasciola gigantica TaxID=46835 RepID=A0A504YUC2_FASGI|nr:putative glycogen synthase kinase 3 (Gsk3) [Fasciola gigantica]
MKPELSSSEFSKKNVTFDTCLVILVSLPNTVVLCCLSYDKLNFFFFNFLFHQLIRYRSKDASFDVLRKLLVYSPKSRSSASQILSDSFFADLIFPPPGHPPNATGHLPNGRPAPQFPNDFTDDELTYLPDDLVSRIRACRDAANLTSTQNVGANTEHSNNASFVSSGYLQRPGQISSINYENHSSVDDTLITSRSARPISGITVTSQNDSSRRLSTGSRHRNLMTTSVIDMRTNPLARHRLNGTGNSVTLTSGTGPVTIAEPMKRAQTARHMSNTQMSRSMHPDLDDQPDSGTLTTRKCATRSRSGYATRSNFSNGSSLRPTNGRSFLFLLHNPDP